MKKDLSEMTLGELWELFPIYLVPHKESWKAQYEKAAALLTEKMPAGSVYRISHIGSTAVRGIMAKDIVDILLETDRDYSFDDAARSIESLGFIRMSSGKDRVSFNRGYTPDGFAPQVFHLHLRLCGDNDELYFRDWLNDYPDVAAEYEKLKLSLWKKYEHDRDAYTQAKTDFVREYTGKAKLLYGEIYK